MHGDMSTDMPPVHRRYTRAAIASAPSRRISTSALGLAARLRAAVTVCSRSWSELAARRGEGDSGNTVRGSAMIRWQRVQFAV
jgi:hypothetical protein